MLFLQNSKAELKKIYLVLYKNNTHLCPVYYLSFEKVDLGKLA